MVTTFFHTVLYILSIIILAAFAVLVSAIAYVAVKMIFFTKKQEQPKK